MRLAFSLLAACASPPCERDLLPGEGCLEYGTGDWVGQPDVPQADGGSEKDEIAECISSLDFGALNLCPDDGGARCIEIVSVPGAGSEGAICRQVYCDRPNTCVWLDGTMPDADCGSLQAAEPDTPGYPYLSDPCE